MFAPNELKRLFIYAVSYQKRNTELIDKLDINIKIKLDDELEKLIEKEQE